jgi:2-polyprenyl-3-methyl-5-hydroxy-6-metoxy-1,4-benzoquinol methylase
MTKPIHSDGAGNPWDHSTHPDFYEYYAKESQSDATLNRFRRTQEAVLRVADQIGLRGPLDVADVGCGAGTQSRLWAELGHRVRSLDVNEPLIQLARERAKAQGLDIIFEVGTATSLPWPDGSSDVCLLPELLEHVADWQSCLSEAARVVRPGGILYVSTTNVLCPVQEEFNLPAYSWYPGALKRYCERLAVTTRPAIANYAKYPAVHWFSFYRLQRFLAPLGFRCLDRFDLIDTTGKAGISKSIVTVLRGLPGLRFLGHVATPSTYLVAIKQR